MEEFHWTPQEIAQIPYKKLQKILILRNQRGVALEAKDNLEKAKRDLKMMASGQVKRMYRNV